jgi:hypothetical protein
MSQTSQAKQRNIFNPPEVDRLFVFADFNQFFIRLWNTSDVRDNEYKAKRENFLFVASRANATCS